MKSGLLATVLLVAVPGTSGADADAGSADASCADPLPHSESLMIQIGSSMLQKKHASRDRMNDVVGDESFEGSEGKLLVDTTTATTAGTVSGEFPSMLQGDTAMMKHSAERKVRKLKHDMAVAGPWTWIESHKGNETGKGDLCDGDWDGHTNKDLTQCQAAGDSAFVRFVAWTDEVYGGFCKVLKKTKWPEKDACLHCCWQGYGYKLYEATLSRPSESSSETITSETSEE